MTRALLAFVFAAALLQAPTVADEWTLQTIDLKSKPQSLSLKTGKNKLHFLRITTARGERLALQACGAELCAAPALRPAPRRVLPAGALPDALVSRGEKNITAAYLGDPTERYPHGVLGDRIEAGSLYVVDRQKRQYELMLDGHSVFEDLSARIADVDKDGADEIIVVKSYLRKGAALAVIELDKPGLTIKAETPAIGRQFRWLNPAGIADFDGDGWPEIALVVTPHIGGTLQLWSYRDKKLDLKLTLDDVSNHAKGSRVLDMAAAADFDGDNITDLAIPDRSRRGIRILSFAGGKAREVARIALPGEVVTELMWVRGREKNIRVLVCGLETGQLAIMTPPGTATAGKK